ncbi:hypothetical protein [Treponema sp.]|uniref:hypothetical protein n=1 Tax=Treponema sp. TaxID=166 RepID=UPI003F047DE1
MKDEKGKKLFTDAEIAEKLGVSPRQISKAKEVDSKADAGIKESLAKGEISLNQAYGSLKKTVRNDEKKAEVPAAEAGKIRKNPAGVKTENAEPSAGRTSKPDENSAGKKAFKNLNLKFRPEDFSLLKSAAREADAAVEEYAVKVLLEKARPF